MSSAAAVENGGVRDEVEAEELTLQLSVPSVSRLEEVALSKTANMKGHQWRLMVVHRQVNSKDVMGAYVQHVGPKSLPNQASWSIVINARITLVNQLDSEKNYTKEFRHQYTPSSTDWGYSSFLRWKEVVNPGRGFVKDDAIILSARLVYPGPNAPPDPTPSSQSHSTSSHLHPSQPHTPSSQPSSLSRTGSSATAPGSLTHQQLTQSSLSQLSSSQDSVSEPLQMTPSSTSVLPPEMALFLCCPHCNEQFEAKGERSPHTIHCGHTFCLGCLQKLLVNTEGGKRQLTCPTCSTRHSVDTTTSSPPWFPNLSVSQLVATVTNKARHLCPTHQHDQNYYCFQDKALVCIYCAYHGEHAGHLCRPVGDARQSAREELRPVRMRVRGRAGELERRLQLLRDEGEGVRLQGQSSVKMVEEYFASLEKALERQRQMLLEDLHSQTRKIQSCLDTKVKELESHRSELQKSLEDYEKWKALPAREALTNLSDISHTLSTAASTSLPPDSAHNSQLRVKVELPLATPLSSLGPLGHVTVTCLSPSLSATTGKQQPAGDETQSVAGCDAMELSQEEREGEKMRGDPASGAVTKRTLVPDTSPNLEHRTKRQKS